MKTVTRKPKLSIIAFDLLNLGTSFFLYFLLAFATLPFFISFFPNISPVKSLLHSITIEYSLYFYAFVAIGALSFLLGFNSANFGVSEVKLRRLWNYKWQPQRTLFVFIVVFVFGIVVKIIRIINDGFFYLDRSSIFTSHPLYSLVGLFDWMGTIALVVALIAYFNFLKAGNRQFRLWHYLVWIVLTTEVLYGFFMGARGPVVMPLVAYVIVRHYMFKRSPAYVLTAFFIIFFVFMTLLNINRSPGVFLDAYHVINREELTAARSSVKMADFRKLAATSLPLVSKERALNFSKYVFDSSILRADQSRIFLAVLDYVYEFKPGESAKKFIASLGPPRFIWKNKPLIHGDISEIGKRSGLIAPLDTTSIGPTILGDWYINFGFLGIVLGMFLIGIIFKFLSRVFIYSETVYPTGLMLFSITWLHTIPGAVEGWMAPLWAGYIKLFVILFVVHLALKGSNLKYTNLTQIYE